MLELLNSRLCITTTHEWKLDQIEVPLESGFLLPVLRQDARQSKRRLKLGQNSERRSTTRLLTSATRAIMFVFVFVCSLKNLVVDLRSPFFPGVAAHWTRVRAGTRKFPRYAHVSPICRRMAGEKWARSLRCIFGNGIIDHACSFRRGTGVVRVRPASAAFHDCNFAQTGGPLRKVTVPWPSPEYRTGNGGKLSSSWFDVLTWLCLAAA